MSIDALHSRRGIVGLLSLFAAAPRAVASQAAEQFREAVFDAPPPMSGYGGYGGMAGINPESLSLTQLAAKALARDANREFRRKQAAISRCRSMSPAAKEAYCRSAAASARTASVRLAQIMGGRAANDDFDEWD